MKELAKLYEFLSSEFNGAKFTPLVDFITNSGEYLSFDSMDSENLNRQSGYFSFIIADKNLEINLATHFKRVDEIRQKLLNLSAKFRNEVFTGIKTLQNKNGIYCIVIGAKFELKWSE